MSNRGLPGSNAMGSLGLHIHVDKCRPILGRQKAITLRNHSDKDKMSVLDGVHVDLRSHDVLPSIAGIPKASF